MAITHSAGDFAVHVSGMYRVAFVSFFSLPALIKGWNDDSYGISISGATLTMINVNK